MLRFTSPSCCSHATFPPALKTRVAPAQGQKLSYLAPYSVRVMPCSQALLLAQTCQPCSVGPTASWASCPFYVPVPSILDVAALSWEAPHLPLLAQPHCGSIADTFSPFWAQMNSPRRPGGGHVARPGLTYV